MHKLEYNVIRNTKRMVPDHMLTYPNQAWCLS